MLFIFLIYPITNQKDVPSHKIKSAAS